MAAARSTARLPWSPKACRRWAPATCNDGVNRIGRPGHGESVRPGFFRHRAVAIPLPDARRRGACGRLSRPLRDALNEHVMGDHQGQPEQVVRRAGADALRPASARASCPSCSPPCTPLLSTRRCLISAICRPQEQAAVDNLMRRPASSIETFSSPGGALLVRRRPRPPRSDCRPVGPRYGRSRNDIGSGPYGAAAHVADDRTDVFAAGYRFARPGSAGPSRVGGAGLAMPDVRIPGPGRAGPA